MTEIRVRLRLTPHLEDMLREVPHRLDLVVPAGTTVRGLLQEAGIPPLAVYTVIQGRSVLHGDDALSNDTELTLLAPVAGG
ncbi:MAG: MoaD/ThiS family protein [Deltaproteobacteria bacterium]|nr:MoaD/ThiS family protein [Deltaproteobacteria bacterium]